MDKWSPFFNPNSVRGITAPVWVRFPCLPLYCWDKENFIKIASRIGAPILLDGNSFKWGKREFSRVCIRLNLENSLLNGVWVDGIASHFFQGIEYEKIDLIFYQCGKVGHESKLCPESVKKVSVEQPVKKADAKKNVDGKVDREGAEETNENYGPWIHVKFKIGGFGMVRGARKKEASLYLNEIVRDHGVCFVGLMETKLSSIDRIEVDFLIGKDWDYFHFPAMGTAGGILVLWNTKIVSFAVERSASQLVIRSLQTPSLGVWKVATIYGSRCNNERRSLWSMLETSLKDSGPSKVVEDIESIIFL
ncbi:uncharacterized protein LOC110102802 [Dendrobium catenatum]|uniref:uncharacterized protein LOC110102802 n=1 Tax=Dendrobium catenatum TaxID=906689 RepID=UPI0010A074EC|nr:uncharacterized protein LOC110102802 [Dendrobium catenatum]